MFIHLRARSHYSFLEALPSPAELAGAAARQGMPALGLVEHHWLTGAIEFYDACRAAGVQPILGLEGDFYPPLGFSPPREAAPLVLLAMDLHGWRSLCRLSSAALTQPSGDVRLPFERLGDEAAGLLCLSGGRRGLAARLAQSGQTQTAAALLARLAEIFPDRLYVELQRHTEEDERSIARLNRLAQDLGLPCVATHSIYYIEEQQADWQRLQAAIRGNKTVDALQPDEVAPPDAWFLPAGRIAARFADYPASLAATLVIAERCRLDLPLGTPHFPSVALPAGVSAIERLREKAAAGAERLYPAPAPLPAGETSPAAAARARLDHELEVIGQLGYAPLFLVMEEIIAEIRRLGIPYSSRGSAASSLVAHCLGITSPDPIRLNLYFERFLNPARATPPDIDTDICSRRRDEVIDFVYRRFGQEKVAMVCTINRFRRRSALRETAKAHGLPPAEVSALAEGLPQRWYGPPERSETDRAPFAELRERYPAARHQRVFEQAAALIGLPHHLSVHPGGIVIAPEALTNLSPVHLAAKGITVTQFDLDSIERLGLVKMDLLGIRGLTVLGDVAAAISSQPAG